MKSLMFSSAILHRNRVRFLYGLDELTVEPYFITCNQTGKKVVYARVIGSNEIKMFEYDHIYNIKIIRADRFSPIIPIMPIIN
ncbi:MAG: hypothetical protein KF816_11635 [Melioribacteraceae bacterium]|nr:hypothetical protein [Melioribacteraceae bacterium]